MSLKRPQNMLAAFSMASMTDVIFLLLIFFMVTSTFVFPTAMDINLPQGTDQAPLKPTTRLFIDAEGRYAVQYADGEPQSVDSVHLMDYLTTVMTQDSAATAVAIYADVDVAYGRVADVLSHGAANNLKMVLATRPAPVRAAAAGTDTPADQPNPDL